MSDTEPTIIRIEIPGEPKGVGRGRTAAGVGPDGQRFTRVYTPTATRTEAGVIRMYAEAAMRGRLPLTGPVDLRCGFYKAIPKSMSKTHREAAIASICLPLTKPDFDNVSKFVDQFKGIIWTDDAIVADWHGWKRFSERPMYVFEIRTMPGCYGWPLPKK